MVLLLAVLGMSTFIEEEGGMGKRELLLKDHSVSLGKRFRVR
jgi:hypothetical protein